MKTLDPRTIETIAELICGSSGQGAGGNSFETPGPYRTKGQIIDFFRGIGIEPAGEASTRKWFVVESLEALDSSVGRISTVASDALRRAVDSKPTSGGSLLADGLRKVILRLCDPREYRGDIETVAAVQRVLNDVLAWEGLKISHNGSVPQLTAISHTPKVEARPKQERIPPPDFVPLVGEPTLADVLRMRWEEAQRCMDAGAHLAAVVMIGSILEGLLLSRAAQNPKEANQSKCAPKDKAGKVREVGDWSLSNLIDVAHDLKWIQLDIKRFSHALRESRNVVHPYQQRLLQEVPDRDTCLICWQVLRAAIADLSLSAAPAV
jgi:hypothetical protein